MLTLYLRLIGARIRAQMQYRISFALDIAGTTAATALEFVVILLLLARFQSVAGWTIEEIGLLYGLTSIAFSLCELIARGFDSPFERMIQQGNFDRVLTRPVGSFFQILASEFQLRRLGRTVQGAAVLAYAFSRLPIDWTLANIILVPLTIISGTAIYGGLAVIGATLCFWTVKTPEVINVFTFGGQQLVSYPLSIYNRWIRTVFLAIIPVAFVNYPVSLVLLERSDPFGLPAQLAWAAPLVATAFFSLALLFWRFGVSKYQSTGS